MMGGRRDPDDKPDSLFEALTGISEDDLLERHQEIQERVADVDEELADAMEELPEHESDVDALSWYTENRNEFIDAAALVIALSAMAGSNSRAMANAIGEDIVRADMRSTGGVEK